MISLTLTKPEPNNPVAIRIPRPKLSWLRGWPQKLWFHSIRPELGACGDAVRIPRSGSYTFETLFLGNHIQIGPRCILWAAHSKIVIHDQVFAGPEIVIMAGDHNVRLLGEFMIDVGEQQKGRGDDQDVVIEEDVWIGTRAIILKGVRVGRGAVIGAGAVVRRRVPPYSIVTGNPAQPHRLRGTVEEILAHETRLYSPEKRLSRQTLEAVAAFVYRPRKP